LKSGFLISFTEILTLFQSLLAIIVSILIRFSPEAHKIKAALVVKIVTSIIKSFLQITISQTGIPDNSFFKISLILLSFTTCLA
jgi:hypothetical protein